MYQPSPTPADVAKMLRSTLSTAEISLRASARTLRDAFADERAALQNDPTLGTPRERFIPLDMKLTVNSHTVTAIWRAKYGADQDNWKDFANTSTGRRKLAAHLNRMPAYQKAFARRWIARLNEFRAVSDVIKGLWYALRTLPPPPAEEVPAQFPLPHELADL